ncbi:MAG: NAD(P)H-binding protein [Gemmatimonadetes bacterium]|nr:NAD(P)H-binding protein [Gemmatimonadota bacterium]
MSSIAIVGVTGTIGGRVARQLVEAGHDVVGLSRGGSEAPNGVRRRLVDLTDESAARNALDGIRALYLTPPESGPDPLALERSVGMNVIAAARDRGVEHVVMHTAVHADRGDTGAKILDNKQPLEAALAASGVPYTILRPAWYLQNLFGAKGYLEQGMFSMPWPADRVWAATDVEDVARAAVAFLENGPANRGFDVHIPGGITAAAICEAVECVTGQAVGYQEAPSSRQAVESYPISDAHKELYAALFDYFRSHSYLGDPLPVTEAVDGFSYGTIEDFMHRELFAGVGV